MRIRGGVVADRVRRVLRPERCAAPSVERILYRCAFRCSALSMGLAANPIAQVDRRR
jgi:hypothetical protein